MLLMKALSNSTSKRTLDVDSKLSSLYPSVRDYNKSPKNHGLAKRNNKSRRGAPPIASKQNCHNRQPTYSTAAPWK